MNEEGSNVEKFLMELFDDQTEKKIIKYISQNKNMEEIIEIILNDMEESE